MYEEKIVSPVWLVSVTVTSKCQHKHFFPHSFSQIAPLYLNLDILPVIKSSLILSVRIFDLSQSVAEKSNILDRVKLEDTKATSFYLHLQLQSNKKPFVPLRVSTIPPAW